MKFSLPILSLFATAGLAAAGIPIVGEYAKLYKNCQAGGPNVVSTDVHLLGL